MNKNLHKAKSWIQKQIDELRAERDTLLSESAERQQRASIISEQMLELEEVLEKLPSEKGEENS